MTSMARLCSTTLLSSMFLLCFCSPFSLSEANILGNETDRLALLAFKSQITQDPYNSLSSWNESNHFCEWEGITCGHKHQRVTKLLLQSRGLVGSIPPHIGNLSFLRSLALSNNNFQGEIPEKLGQLSRLENLSLSNNSLMGNIPVSLSSCYNLEYLYLTANNLVGSIPTEIGSLSKLIHLLFRSNQLTGRIPPSLGNLTLLQSIDLSNNKLDGNIPSTVGQLKNLHFLSLVKNRFSGAVPPSLYNLSNLEKFSVILNNLTGDLPFDIGVMLPNINVFYIGGNRFFGSIPTLLFNASKLERLDLAENQFTGKIPLTVGNLKNLQVFNLAVNRLGSGKPGDLDFVTFLTNCSNLYDLNMDGNYLGGTLPTSVGNFSSQLSALHFQENRISGNIPSEIQNLQNLSFLSLADNFIVGSIPSIFSNMQNLRVLSLRSNQLSGQVPSTKNMSNLFSLLLGGNLLEGSISLALEAPRLQGCDLSYNRFSGTIPKQIVHSSQLREVDLTQNLLNGSIPVEVGNLKNLNLFAVSRNNISGEIPNTLISCSSLQELYLDGNSLHGSVPSSMDSLVDLHFLDLSRNKLSGEIPKELSKMSSLLNLNLSFNDFQGEVPTEGIFKNVTAFSILGNLKVCGGISVLHLTKCHNQSSKKQKSTLSLKLTLGVSLPLFTAIMVLVIYLTRKSQSENSSDRSGLDHKRVSYIDLHKATNGFSPANLIGTGRYGFVYKGMHREGELIAVKVLNLVEDGALKTFSAECEALRVIRHRNLLKIISVCSSVDFKALVFEFMRNGSLDTWLHPDGSQIEQEPKYLTFHQRLSIAIDIASALDYLHNHCEEPITHCDLKAANVLLGDDLTAHVGDFGLAKFLSTTSTSNATDTSSSSVRGTIGYIPPEYGAGGKVSTQGDVYSYGILLLEMFTGKRPTDTIFKDGLTLHDYSQSALPDRVMEIIDIRAVFEFQDETTSTTYQLKESLISVVRIGVACSKNVMTERMSIKTAFNKLSSVKRNFA